MWDHVDEETGAEQEKKLESVYWRSMIERQTLTESEQPFRDSYTYNQRSKQEECPSPPKGDDGPSVTASDHGW